jgi:hypothetical protein
MQSSTSSSLSKSVKLPPSTRREGKHLPIIMRFLMSLENFEYIPFENVAETAISTATGFVDPRGSLLSLAYNRYHYYL